MAPTVKVPTNFGKKHIGSLTHSNLVLNLQDGKTSRANSLILSFNSPVIMNLISNVEVELTSLDMLQFAAPAVDCFVDACYTGEVEMMEKAVFRDTFKMAEAFEVFWLQKRCSRYFKQLVRQMDGNSYANMLFLFEEAEYFLTVSKDRVFFEMMIDEMGSVDGKAVFIPKYLEKYNDLSTSKLDLIIQLAGSDLHVVVEALTSQLTKHLEVHGAILTEKTRYLLENADLSICHGSNPLVYENLFDLLQSKGDFSKDVVEWIFSLYRKFSRKRRRISEEKASLAASSSSLVTVTPTATTVRPTTKISNLFHSSDHFVDLKTVDEVFNILANDPCVKNSLMLLEAFCTWARARFYDRGSEVVLKQIGSVSSKEFLDKLVELEQSRGWSGVPKQCFDYRWSCGGVSWRTFSKWKELENHPSLGSVVPKRKYVLVSSTPQTQVLFSDLTEKINKLVYFFKHPKTSTCLREGACGFVVKTTPPWIDNPDRFNIELCVDESEYPAEVHLHGDLIRADDMHLMLEFQPCSGWWTGIIPLSWSGKPYHNGEHWSWGDFSTSKRSDRASPNNSMRFKVLYTV